MRSTYSFLENQSACRCFKAHAFLNKHPPAKPVVFHVRAKPYNTSGALEGAQTICQLLKLLLAALKRAVTLFS